MNKPINRFGSYLSTVPNTLTPCTLQVPAVITLFLMAGYLVCTRQSYTRQSSSTIIKALSTNNFRNAWRILSVKQTIPSCPVLNRQYQDEYNTNQNQMKNMLHVYIVFQVLKLPLKNICKINHQIFYFLLFYISLYIIRLLFFSQIIRTSFNTIWKKKIW